MKLLSIHSANNPDSSVSQVDIWRVWRPLREMRKHLDWEITEAASIVPNIEDIKNAEEYTEEEMQRTVDFVKQFDVVYGSYTSFMNPAIFSLMLYVQDKHGVKFVMDVDDNVFSINEDNIGWWLKMGHEQTFHLQQVVKHCAYITTSTDILAKEIQKRNPKAVIKVVPNYISTDYKAPVPNNKDIVRIGYFGGASHYGDLHWTNCLKAIQKLMHENKNVHFVSAGIPIEDYLPTKRKHYDAGARGHAWVNEVVPRLNYDVAIAPLLDNPFNNCKTAIKWQEATMMHAPLVASNVSPYKQQIRSGNDGILVANDIDEWYKALKKLVEEPEYRKKLVSAARKRVDGMLIEDNWETLSNALKEVHNANNKTSKQSIILQA